MSLAGNRSQQTEDTALETNFINKPKILFVPESGVKRPQTQQVPGDTVGISEDTAISRKMGQEDQRYDACHVLGSTDFNRPKLPHFSETGASRMKILNRLGLRIKDIMLPSDGGHWTKAAPMRDILVEMPVNIM